jgi:5-hydroxyisourate hydrolase-like protein (transthyretin family)
MTELRYLVYSISTDLYDSAYAPKEVMLAMVVTRDSITVRLLGKTEQDTYAPLPNMVVHVYELVNGVTWSSIGDFTTDENGRIIISRENTAEWYKAVFDGTDEYMNATAYAWLIECGQPARCAATECNFLFWLLLTLLALTKRRELSV